MAGKLPKLPAWHAGEIYLQERIGVAERMRAVGQRVVRDYMPDQHREFYAQLPFIVLGSVDGAGDAWATILTGRPGFMASPTPTSLDIAAQADPADPAGAGLQAGAPIGLLGIEMHTRRRNRMNGIVSPAGGGLHVEVDQSFGNCPRYIQLRDCRFAREPGQPPAAPPEDLPALDPAARAMIEGADAFFVASYADRAERRQVDVSHRGGKAGFVRVGDDGLLTVPDFDGNLFFATLGNFVLNGKAGLIFIDYERGDVLQMTGDATVLLDSPETAAFQGAERLWTFRARRIVRRRGALALRWRFQPDGWSPNALMTGDWAQAASRLRARELAGRWRPFTVARIVDESASIRSFHLRPADGLGLPAHAAGQHLPIRVTPPGAAAPALRSYTLSLAPSDDAYRISVKRAGAISRHLHEHIQVGDIIEAGAPAGGFVLDARERRPAVLLAGGVGITPMLAMLRDIVHEGLRTRRVRPAILFQAARHKADRAFDAELSGLAAAAQGAVRLVRVLSDPTGAEAGRDYDAAGRIDMALLTRFLAFDDYDFYLCGPPGFMQALYDGLRGYGVADCRIHAESFGPASLARDAGGAAAAPAPARRPASAVPVSVAFLESLKEARWTPGSGTLLDLAEARGLAPASGCRAGSCGTCRTRLLKGEVTYIREPAAAVAEGEVLICCAVPAEPADASAEPVHLAL